MGLNLSQEEIDALLKAGFSQPDEGDADTSQEEQFEPNYQHHQFDDFAEQEAYQQPQGYEQPRQRPKLRRSAKVDQKVPVQTAEFESFDDEEFPEDVTNLEIILNLDLEIRVELGKTRSTVRDVLEMGSGSVIELQKLNGEPVDLLINKKPFAKGEMIVIGDNFGVRVTDIDSVPELIEAMQ